MNVLPFLLLLALIVIVAKSAGYLSTRLGQPAVLGELLAGLLLGPTVLDMLHWPVFGDAPLGETVSYLSHLGVLFLMFLAGLEVDLESLREIGRLAVLVGGLGVALPVILGMVVALPFGFDLPAAIFVGLILAATSVSISAQTCMELGVLRSAVGACLLSAAVVDDVLVILFLSLFLALVGEGTGPFDILWVVTRMVIFLALAVVLGARLIPRLGAIVDRLPISEGVMALVFAVVLLYAWAAEAVGGMAAITGAFLAGLLLARTPLGRRIETGMHTMAYAWLVPIFFVSIGLEADTRALGLEGLPFALLLAVAAVLSKILGCGTGARLGGLTNRDALRLGVGMVSRGEVGLIVATVGVDAGLIGENVFASVVLVVLVTTLITPLLLRLLYPHPACEPD